MANTIYALFVGIVAYDDRIAVDNGSVAFPALSGCVNDAKKMHEALKTIAGSSTLRALQLFNEQATKKNIVEAIKNHLGQATKDDAILFYYSGHGTQEIADPCWKTGTGPYLEALACYYDKNTATNFLLADKELRYLLDKLAANGPKITVIFDCCHSGDATRNAEILEINYNDPIPKRSKGTYAFSQRAWNDFIFHEEFQPADVVAKGVRTLLPEAPHTLFSAAESNQSAFEINGEGIFTKHLLRLLQATKGYISNQTLYDRLALSMRYAYEQTPRIYTPPAAASFRNESFLDGRPVPAEGQAVVFHANNTGWMVNRGELSGLYVGMPEIQLSSPDNATAPVIATVREANIDHALLDLPEKTNPQSTWLADLGHLSMKPLNLFCNLVDALPADVESLLEALNETMPQSVTLVAKETGADYTLQHLDGRYYLTKPNDKYRPIADVVTVPEKPDVPPNFRPPATQLKHLSQWTFIHQLSKPRSGGKNSADPILVEYKSGDTKGGYKPIPGPGETPTIALDNWDIADNGISTNLCIRLTNQTGTPFYVSLLYLDIDHAVGTQLLQPSPYLLNAKGESVELQSDGDTVMAVYLSPYVSWYNWQQYTERFKLIVSDKPFEVGTLELDTLPEPPTPGQTRGIGASKGSIAGKRKPFVGFYIATVDIIYVNPSYNKITTGQLNTMLNDKVTSPFAEGLYLTTTAGVTSALGLGEWKVRPEITVDDPPASGKTPVAKSVAVDIANWWTRRRRNKYYAGIQKRFPNRLRIVSEGDSWFQHPLVYDIIDHLSRVYAIHCVAAAADTLSNYLSGAHKRGEYFLDVLEVDKPPIFLISGGGNDILGSQFRDFLIADPYSKGLKGCPDGSKFLNQAFADQIDKIMAIYSTIFGKLKTDHPKMITIVHGYDYPVHLDHPDKGWLGRYMIEKGIAEPADRRTVIHYIMDTFNTRLAAVVAKFPDSVRYLNLRETVLYRPGEINQWYDEIHPNIDGFQSIGLKFIQLIEDIAKRP